MAARIYQEVVRRSGVKPPPAILVFWKTRGELPVDLSRFFNNDGVADAKQPDDTNFDCPDHPASVAGSGYPAENLPTSGSVFTVKASGDTFLFPVLTPGEYNNVACEGQRISSEGQRTWPRKGEACSELVLLGAAENGDAAADLRLEYEDESVQSVKIRFPDWCAPLAAGETVAVSSPYRYARNAQSRKNAQHKIDCHLYVRRVAVDPGRRLAALILPEKANLHLFAVSFKVRPATKAMAHRADLLARKFREVALLAKAPAAQLDKPIGELEAELIAAEARIDPQLQRQLVWLKTQCEYLIYRLGRGTVRRGSASERWGREQMTAIRADLKMLLAGTDPFRRRRGHLLKGYVSEIDGQIQPYAVYVPREYQTTGKRSPLAIHMHGHGWYRPFQGIPTYPFRDAVVVSPHGRGSMDYMFVAEEDVLTCIAEAQKDYHIDPDRVYLLGGSMGGTGCWSLATKFPDRFAAIGPSAANADSRAWRSVGAKHAKDQGSYAWLRTQIRRALDPVTCAGNLLHVPAYFLHGDRDKVVPVGNSRSMAKALEAFRDDGVRFVYREGKGGGHGWRPRHYVAEQHDFIFASRRPERPRRVHLKAACLKYGKAYWVRILQMGRSDQVAELDADVQGGSLIHLKTRNTTTIELDLSHCPVDTDKALIIAVNGQAAFNGFAPADGTVRLARSGSRWQVSGPPSGLHKKPYLEGPVADAYTRSFLVVVGTRSAGPLDRSALKQEAERFAADWELLYTKPPRLKTDEQVTEEDIQRHNLILYGGPSDNGVTERIADRLPIRFKNGAVQVGGRSYSGNGVAAKFCYPNPLNPERLVVVIAGARRGRDVFQSNTLFGNWFQWGPYDNRAWFDYAVFDRKTHSAETCLEFGFFGADWGLNRVTSWFGEAEARQSTPLRRVPARRAPPDQMVVYLTDLLPALISQHKLPVGFDTSAEGRTLSIGRRGDASFREYPRGLGVRAPSKVAFNIHNAKTPADKRFTRFRATVGIDLEGETTVPSWRDRSEWVMFFVHGDGRLLYQTGRVKWNSRPISVAVPVERVKQLSLEVWCTNARWLVGSAAWANARLIREKTKAGK